jgi:hypothetical protein
MIDFVKQNWQIVLPIFMSIVTAVWTFFVWKRQKMLENRLARSISAYDIILKKEFEYYQESDSIFAELVVCVGDIEASITNGYPRPLSRNDRCEIGRDNLMCYLDSIKLLKNLRLRYEVYLPDSVRESVTEVVVKMKANMDLFSDSLKLLFDGKESEIDTEMCIEAALLVSVAISVARATVISRLTELTKIK